jgi:hypothetical protein
MGSAGTGFRKIDVASFPAIRAIVQAIHAKTNIVEALADGAVLVTGALILGLVALDTENWANRHRGLLKKDFT